MIKSRTISRPTCWRSWLFATRRRSDSRFGCGAVPNGTWSTCGLFRRRLAVTFSWLALSAIFPFAAGSEDLDLTRKEGSPSRGSLLTSRKSSGTTTVVSLTVVNGLGCTTRALYTQREPERKYAMHERTEEQLQHGRNQNMTLLPPSPGSTRGSHLRTTTLPQPRQPGHSHHPHRIQQVAGTISHRRQKSHSPRWSGTVSGFHTGGHALAVFAIGSGRKVAFCDFRLPFMSCRRTVSRGRRTAVGDVSLVTDRESAVR